MKRILALSQGVYFSLTGIWPIIDIHSFTYVTGPKTDWWLVKMVGLLACCIGIVLTVDGLRKIFQLEIKILAIGSAMAFFVYRCRLRHTRYYPSCISF